MKQPAISSHRAFVRISSGEIHYRQLGRGPTILLIHGSPQSSRAVMPLAYFLVEKGFSVICPDTPGYGLSSPLSLEHKATTDDYAFVLAEFVDTIGLEYFGLYGFHSGAAIACTFAAIYPEKVSALVCEGLPAWTTTEKTECLNNYLPEFKVKWDGSHLCWVWARIEEQLAFFPWYEISNDTRMSFDINSPQHIHANVMDLLEAGDHYGDAYYAAFTFTIENYLAKVQMPHLFACLHKDPLSVHYKRDVFRQSNTKLFNELPEMWQDFSNFFKMYLDDNAEVFKPHKPNHSHIFSAWVGEPEKALAWRGNATSRELSNNLVLLHDAGGNKDMFNSLMPLLARRRSVIAFDLPGHGHSESRSDTSICMTIEAIAKEIDEACLRLNISDYTVVGYDFGGLVAASMTHQGYAKKGASIGLKTIPENLRSDWSKYYAPDLSAQWDGTHLIKAFRIARWERLFYPWFRRTHDSALKPIENLDPINVHQRALNLLRAGKSWQAAIKALADYDLASLQNLDSKFEFYTLQKGINISDFTHLKAEEKLLSADVLSWESVLTTI